MLRRKNTVLSHNNPVCSVTHCKAWKGHVGCPLPSNWLLRCGGQLACPFQVLQWITEHIHTLCTCHLHAPFDGPAAAFQLSSHPPPHPPPLDPTHSLHPAQRSTLCPTCCQCWRQSATCPTGRVCTTSTEGVLTETGHSVCVDFGGGDRAERGGLDLGEEGCFGWGWGVSRVSRCLGQRGWVWRHSGHQHTAQPICKAGGRAHNPSCRQAAPAVAAVNRHS